MSLIEKIAASFTTEWLTDDEKRTLAQAALTAIMDAGDGVQEDAEFTKAVWGALKGDHNDLRREAIILRAHREARARHRSTAAAAERARIVAWLRGHEAFSHIGGKFMADAIERGEV